MKRFVKCMALTAALGLLAAGAADANGKGGGGGGRGGSGGSKGGSMSGGSKGGSMSGGFKTSQSKSGSFGKGDSSFKHNWSGKFDNSKGNWKNYHAKHGQKFGQYGWCYKGQNHCHWSSWCWNPSWGCYNYWCPSTCCYYYWYQPHCCYYPLSYINQCVPVAYAAPEVVPAAAGPVINIQNSAANAGGVAANNAPGGPLPQVPPGVQP